MIIGLLAGTSLSTVFIEPGESTLDAAEIYGKVSTGIAWTCIFIILIDVFMRSTKDQKIGSAPLLRFIIASGTYASYGVLELLNESIVYRGRASAYFAAQTESYYNWLGEGQLKWFEGGINKDYYDYANCDGEQQSTESVRILQEDDCEEIIRNFFDTALWHICIFVVIWFLVLFMKNQVRRSKPFASLLKSLIYFFTFAWSSYFVFWINHTYQQHIMLNEQERQGFPIEWKNDIVYIVSLFSAVFIGLNIIFGIVKLFKIANKTRNHRLSGAIGETEHMKRARAFHIGDVNGRDLDSEDSSDGENSCKLYSFILRPTFKPH